MAFSSHKTYINNPLSLWQESLPPVIERRYRYLGVANTIVQLCRIHAYVVMRSLPPMQSEVRSEAKGLQHDSKRIQRDRSMFLAAGLAATCTCWLLRVSSV
jgi:hypothetical protein